MTEREDTAAATVSIVVCVRDGEHTIGACLERLLESDLGRDEIIVVDDGSRDSTPKILRELPVRVVQCAESRGAAAARNLGAQEATGEILVFVDADVLVPLRSRQTITATLESERSVDVVQGYYDTTHPNADAPSLYKNTWISYSFEVSGDVATSLFSCFVAMRRAEFLAAEGYATSRQSSDATDDFEFGLRLGRLGRHIRRSDALRCVHLKRYTFKSLLENQFRRSRALTRLYLQQGEGLRVVRRLRMGNIGPGFIVRTMLAPWLAAATIPAALGCPLPLALLVSSELGLSAPFLWFSARRLKRPLVLAFIPIGYADVLTSSLGVVAGVADASVALVGTPRPQVPRA